MQQMAGQLGMFNSMAIPFGAHCSDTPALKQRQAELMASFAQDGYLSPMVAFTAAQMQQMVALNMSVLTASPVTPASGGSTFPGVTSPDVHA